MKVRLNRFLAESGIASRRKSELFIQEARVQVNNKIIIDLAFVVDTDVDIVKVDGEKIRQQKKVYFLLNKPKNYITTTEDERGRKTVLDLINTKEKIFPVGRLDSDTTGVLILTNDGDFANFLMHPRNKVPREYIATLDKPLEEDAKDKLWKGITLDRRKSRFITITYTNKEYHDKVKVVTEEGRNHFVKRMFETLGYNVKKLERISYGNFNVKGMPLGSYRNLTPKEIKSVYETYGL